MPKLNGAIGIQIFDANERQIVEFFSKYKAAHALQISDTTFRRYSNTLTFIYSPFLEICIKIVEVIDPLNKKEVQFNSMQKYPIIKELDFNSIEAGKLVSFTKDKKKILGIYSSPGEAASILDNKKESRYISRYINLERTVKVGPARIEVYFVMNPEYLKNTSLRQANKYPNNIRAIVLVDTIKNTAIKYSSIKELLEVLNIKSTGSTAIVKRYMNPTKLYKNSYSFHYAQNLKGDLTT